ncbi:MAG: site-2 protease family protein [Armatimonadota bacterium]|nr:site-2 protease family protein [Armatimonadota bacterium]
MGDPSTIVIMLVVILGSIALHEFAHAKSADSYGDPTPRLQGRVTLNPIAHLDPMGTIMIFITALTGFGIGWGKPVQVDPRKMDNPRWDHLFSVLWGPLTNVIIAVGIAFIWRVLGAMEVAVPYWFEMFAKLGVTLNLGLAAFNMIPIGPLDGHWILGLLLPPEIGHKFMLWSRTSGTFILLGLVLLGQISGSGGVIGAYYVSVVVPAAEYLLGVPIFTG